MLRARKKIKQNIEAEARAEATSCQVRGQECLHVVSKMRRVEPANSQGQSILEEGRKAVQKPWGRVSSFAKMSRVSRVQDRLPAKGGRRVRWRGRGAVAMVTTVGCLLTFLMLYSRGPWGEKTSRRTKKKGRAFWEL